MRRTFPSRRTSIWVLPNWTFLSTIASSTSRTTGKVSQRLTLNLGLTYSYYGQPAHLFNRNDVRHILSNEPFWNPSLPSSVTEFPNLPAPKNSWGPSIGFAYAVGHGGWLLGDDKTVFRGGYRRSYDPPFYNIYLNIASSSPQVLAQTIPGLAQGTPQPAALPAVPTGTNVRSELSPFLTLGVSDPRDFNQTSVVPNFRPDHVDSWSFGIQRELGAHAAFEARYVGNRGRNLFQSVNGNPYVGCPSGEDAANDGWFERGAHCRHPWFASRTGGWNRRWLFQREPLAAGPNTLFGCQRGGCICDWPRKL